MLEDITIKRTHSKDPDFIKLVARLDAYLAVCDGKEHSFYAQFNKIDTIKNVVVAYIGREAAGCGAFKFYDEHTVEIKRMFVAEAFRNQGVAAAILTALENWAVACGFTKAVLETGRRQTEAIALYHKMNYTNISNYGQYVGIDNSLCMQKCL